jgi:hypothetical protein
LQTSPRSNLFSSYGGFRGESTIAGAFAAFSSSDADRNADEKG